MPTLNELLEAKADRLDSVPDAFLTQVQKVEKQLLVEIEDLLAQFDLDDEGNFIISEANVAKAAELDVKLRAALDRSEYGEAVTEFAKQFNVQIGVNDVYFAQAFKGFETSEIGKMIVRQAQKNAIELLVNTSPDADFIIPVKQQIENAVINGARWRETLTAIQDAVIGYTGPDGAIKDGKIMQYSKQISHDSFAIADRSYSASVAEQVGASWFKYSGNKIKTSRVFCIERHNKFFCKKEIEMWGDGERTEGFATPQAGTWAGEFEGTNGKTIFSVAGGYNCRHSIMAVSIFAVPIEQVKRAVELGYYEPTKFEREELGL